MLPVGQGRRPFRTFSRSNPGSHASVGSFSETQPDPRVAMAPTILTLTASAFPSFNPVSHRSRFSSRRPSPAHCSGESSRLGPSVKHRLSGERLNPGGRPPLDSCKSSSPPSTTSAATSNANHTKPPSMPFRPFQCFEARRGGWSQRTGMQPLSRCCRPSPIGDDRLNSDRYSVPLLSSRWSHVVSLGTTDLSCGRCRKNLARRR